MLYLTIKGDLSSNIDKVTLRDTETDPAEFTFNVVCIICR